LSVKRRAAKHPKFRLLVLLFYDTPKKREFLGLWTDNATAPLNPLSLESEKLILLAKSSLSLF